MTKLSNLITIGINQDTIEIQGVSIPIVLNFKAFAFIAEAYGKEYHEFERALNKTLKEGNVEINERNTHLMNVLIYGMVRAAGTECTLKEIETSIPLVELPAIFQRALVIFNAQYFQSDDAAKIKNEKKK